MFSATSSSGTSSAIATTIAYCVPNDTGSQPNRRTSAMPTASVSGTYASMTQPPTASSRRQAAKAIHRLASVADAT